MDISVKNCARCGRDHANLDFVDLDNHDEYSCWSACPETGQPILLKIVEDEMDDKSLAQIIKEEIEKRGEMDVKKERDIQYNMGFVDALNKVLELID